MRVAIIGCGLNSDYHFNFARTYPGAEIVGLVDLDEQNAKKAADRFKIPKIYKNIDSLVEESRPQVIHVVTPPRTHFQVAREALEKGCHVLMEKPLALNLEEGEELYNSADKNGVKLCTMHNHFFDPCMVKARKLIDEGQLGKIINVESYYGLNTRIDAFRKYPRPDVLPWLYTLPGGVFHDFMAHPLYVMLPYVGRPGEVKVMEKSFGELPQNISDELRIMINGEKTFGNLTFSFAAKPHLHFLRIIGTRMVIHVDFNMMTMVVHPLSGLPKAAQKATYNLSESKQLFTSTVSNMFNFVRGKLKPYHGMQTLIHQFYDNIQGKGEMPVSREEALQVIRTMDEIFKQVKNTQLTFKTIIPKSSGMTQEGYPKILVTGAGGFLGTRLIEMLVEKGYPVRALVRKLSDTRKLKELGVEIFFGDVGSLESVRPAFAGIEVVVHAAADTAGDEQDSERSTIQGTRNIIEAAREVQAKKMVYISSCSVYGVADYKTGEVVTEESALERFSERRGYYSHGKLKAEEIVIQTMREATLPIVCLRPGTIFGPGGEIYTPMMGFSLGTKLFAVIGNGKFALPLVYIDNLVQAILLAIKKNDGIGRTYNVVDPGSMTKKEYVDGLLRRRYPQAKVFYFPYFLLNTMVFSQEVLMKLLKRNPFLTRYRLISSQRSIRYDSSKIKNELGWDAKITSKEAFNRILAFEMAKQEQN